MDSRKARKKAKTSVLGLRGKAGLALVLVLLAAAIAVGGTMAAYTHQSYVKGVAATNESDILFLSDSLPRCTSGTDAGNYSLQKLITGGSEDTVSISFFIRNYIGSRVNENNITYELTVTPSADPESGSYFLAQNGGTQVVFSTANPFEDTFTLPANTATQHSFTITLPKAAMDAGTNFTVEAVPDTYSTNAAGGYILAAVLQPSIIAGTAEMRCSGAFADKSNTNHPYDMDAFNYSITVSNATEDISVVLSWDPACVEIDPFFLETHTLSVAHDNGTRRDSVTILATERSYLVQFYRRVTANEAGWQLSWEAMDAAHVISVSVP